MPAGRGQGLQLPAHQTVVQTSPVAEVIPTRKNQPRDDKFDKETYKLRNIVERVVGWYKESRSLGTRYEKLAVNYVALWLVAIIDKALLRLFPNNDLKYAPNSRQVSRPFSHLIAAV